MKSVGDLLIEFKETPRPGEDLPALTLTEHNGFVRQSDRFKKRLALEDTSGYQVVRRNNIAFNPYLLWAGAVAQNTIVDAGVISPLYPTFQVRDGHDPRFVARLLLTPQLVGAYDSIAFGSVPRRRRSSVADFLALPLVDVPGLGEQRRIATVLDHADALRAKRRQVLAHLDSLTQSFFHNMFDTQSSLMPFADACTRVTVGVVIRPASYYVAYGVPALRTRNVKPGSILATDLVYFSKEANSGPLAKSRLRGGDLVIARTGNAGTTAIVPPELEGANAIDLIIASPNTEVAIATYLQVLLNSETGKRIVQSESRGQIQQHFNVGSLNTAMVPVPPLPLQREFASRVNRVDMQRARITQTLSADDELFASLQSRAFRGEL